MKVIYILFSCRNAEEAKNLSRQLLEKRLIACASHFPVTSLYRWEGKIEEADEVKIIFKTQPHHFEAIRQFLQSHCSYATAEILQIDITRANPNYLSWLIQETS